MTLQQLFNLKYELLEEKETVLKTKSFISEEEKKVFEDAYDDAIHLFFVRSMNTILDNENSTTKVA